MSNLYKEKLDQAVEYLNQENIDLWMIFSSEGSDPAVGLMLGLKTVGRTFFLITKTGKKIAICSQIDAQESEESGLFDEVIKYYAEAGDVLKEEIKKLNPKSIAINYSMDDPLCDGLTTGRYRWLLEHLPEFSDYFISSEVILSKIRAIKTAEEINRIKKAIEITLEIYDEVFSKAKAGMTELEIGELFLAGMKKRNVVEGTSKKMEMPIVMKDRISHRLPSDSIIEKGDFLIIDFGVDYQGYVSDIARTLYFLKDDETDAPKELLDTFHAAKEAITLAFHTAKPGVRGIEVDAAARNYYKKLGLPDITHSVGHQIGRATHDGGTMLAPNWERYGTANMGLLEENMCFTLEPTILRKEGFSVLTEDDIIITKNGAEFLSKRQEELILIR